jgi:CheY-specific phosphatase CheX
MSNRLQTVLLQATVSTFEEMGYILPTHEIDEDQLLAKRAISVSIDFKGPMEGMFVLHTYGQWLSILAANMMGEDDSPSEKLQQDAVGEVANIICGNILQSLVDPDTKYQLDSPRFLDSRDVDSYQTITPACQTEMGVEDGRITVLLIITKSSIE